MKVSLKPIVNNQRPLTAIKTSHQKTSYLQNQESIKNLQPDNQIQERPQSTKQHLLSTLSHAQSQPLLNVKPVSAQNHLATINVRPKSSYLGNPKRPVNYCSRVFTTDVISIDKQIDDVEEIILKYNKRPKTTEKKVRIDIDLHEKYKHQMMLKELYGSQSLGQHFDTKTNYQSEGMMLQRMSIASTKYTTANHAIRGQSANSYAQSRRHQSAKSSQKLNSPISRNFDAPMSSLMSQNLSQKPLPKHAMIKKTLQYSQSQKSFKAQEYQEFFAKNQDQAFGIAQYVIKGTKIQSKPKVQQLKEQSKNTEQLIQTEEADTLSECNFVFIDEEKDEEIKQELSPQSSDSNLIYQGAHVKVFSPPVEVVKHGRPMSAAPTQIVSKKFQKKPESSKDIKQLENKNDDHEPITIDELIQPQQRFNSSKMLQTLKNDVPLHRSIFRDKSSKVLELTDYLHLILDDYQQEKFEENQNQVNDTLQRFNVTSLASEEQVSNGIDSKKVSTSSQKEENLKQDENSMIQSTGLRLRQQTAKYGTKIDMISHGFQHFKVKDIEQFFDPMRLKLMMITLSDIPNIHTKSGSDYFFVQGFKLQQMNDLQKSLNAYEQGIKEYPDNSFNCKFNKAVILFKLGFFREALTIYRQIFKEEPMDKRLCFNKAICELQNGIYSQCIYTIDSYVDSFNNRKARLELDKKGVEVINYQDKIQLQKPNYTPDNQFLYEIYQIRGIACLRFNKIFEASKSFAKAQEYKQLLSSPQNDQPTQTLIKEQNEDFTEITLQKTQQIQQAQDSGTPSSVNIRIRPLTAQMPRSQSQNLFKTLQQQRLETLEEDANEVKGENINTITDDWFSLNVDNIIRELDDYDQEHKNIHKDLKYLSNIKNTTSNIITNRNIDPFLKRQKSQNILHKIPKQTFYFSNKNLMRTMDKPKGIIANFIHQQTQIRQGKSLNKQQTQNNFKTIDVSSINQKTQQQSQDLLPSKSSSFNTENIMPMLNEQKEQVDHIEVTEVEGEIIMKHSDYYIDSEKKIRLDKVLLGFEIDPLNDSITEDELMVREKRQKLEQEYGVKGEDSFYTKQQQFIESNANKDYFLQFLNIQDKDLLQECHQKLSAQHTQEFQNLQNDMDNFEQHIESTFNDPIKADLHLDKQKVIAQQMQELLDEQSVLNNEVNQPSKLLSADVHPSNEQKPTLLKRLKVEQMEKVIDELQKPVFARNHQLINQLIGGLKFFIKFPMELRQQLLDISILRRFNKGEVIFRQGDRSEDFFVIVKGSVCVRVVKEELGNLPVNTRVCYDGDYIGELAHFQLSESLSQEMVEELNRQRVTTTALETPCYLLQINKQLASQIINSPELQSKYEARINFLRQLDIFAEVDMYILLPLASNIQVKRYKIGEYIVKAGDLPDGLIIVTEGQCIVCAEKLGMRSNKESEYNKLHPKPPNVKTNPTGSSHIVLDKNQLKTKRIKHSFIKTTNSQNGMMKYFSDSLAQVNTHHKAYQNEQILVDDKGKRLKDFTVYKDLMIFFELLPKSYFGGRVLLPIQQKKETADEKGLNGKQSLNDGRRRGAWFAGGEKNAKLSQGMQGIGDFEHLFIKRRYSKTTQKIYKNDRSSMLSVIANSSTVEVYIIDQQLLEFFPEHTQKHFWSKLMHVFEPDRPYMLKNVQKIKDKFREWDVYKIKTVQEHMKFNYNKRLQQKQKQVVELER